MAEHGAEQCGLPRRIATCAAACVVVANREREYVPLRASSGEIGLDGVRGYAAASTFTGDVEIEVDGSVARIESNDGDAAVGIGESARLQAPRGSGQLDAMCARLHV